MELARLLEKLRIYDTASMILLKKPLLAKNRLLMSFNQTVNTKP